MKLICRETGKSSGSRYKRVNYARNYTVTVFARKAISQREFAADKQTKGSAARLIHKNTFSRRGTGWERGTGATKIVRWPASFTPFAANVSTAQRMESAGLKTEIAPDASRGRLKILSSLAGPLDAMFARAYSRLVACSRRNELKRVWTPSCSLVAYRSSGASARFIAFPPVAAWPVVAACALEIETDRGLRAARKFIRRHEKCSASAWNKFR